MYLLVLHLCPYRILPIFLKILIQEYKLLDSGGLKYGKSISRSSKNITVESKAIFRRVGSNKASSGYWGFISASYWQKKLSKFAGLFLFWILQP